jgi:hypothetical protein
MEVRSLRGKILSQVIFHLLNFDAHVARLTLEKSRCWARSVSFIHHKALALRYPTTIRSDSWSALFAENGLPKLRRWKIT